MRSVTTLLFASLLGIGLAYCACAFLLPAIAHEGAGVVAASADGRSQDVICSGSDAAASPQAMRAGD